MSLVRAAWERRPEGPAYLLSIVMLLYLAGQCAFFCTHTPHWTSGNRRGFPEFLRTDSESSDCHQLCSERESTVQEALVFLENYFLGDIGPPPLPSPKTKTPVYGGVLHDSPPLKDPPPGRIPSGLPLNHMLHRPSEDIRGRSRGLLAR